MEGVLALLELLESGRTADAVLAELEARVGTLETALRRVREDVVRRRRTAAAATRRLEELVVGPRLERRGVGVGEV